MKLFTRRGRGPSPARLPAPQLSGYWSPEAAEVRNAARARAEAALRLLRNVEPTNRALAGWGGWLHADEEQG